MAYSTGIKNPSNVGTEVYSAAYWETTNAEGLTFGTTSITPTGVNGFVQPTQLKGTELIDLTQGEVWWRMPVVAMDGQPVAAAFGVQAAYTVEDSRTTNRERIAIGTFYQPADATFPAEYPAHGGRGIITSPPATQLPAWDKYAWPADSLAADNRVDWVRFAATESHIYCRIKFNDIDPDTGDAAIGFYTKATLGAAWTARWFRAPSSIATGVLFLNFQGRSVDMPSGGLFEINGNKASVGTPPEPTPVPDPTPPDSVVVIDEPDAVNDLRLEIETGDNPDNRIANPDGEQGTWGWYRGNDDPNLVFDFDSAKGMFRLRSAINGGLRNVYTDRIAVRGGQKVRAAIFTTDAAASTGLLGMDVQFYNAAGTSVGRSESGGTIAAPIYTPIWTVPSTAVEARLIIEVGLISNGTFYSGGNDKTVYFRDVDFRVGDTDTDVSGTTYIPAVTYRNVLNNTTEVKIKRAELEVGILSAVVHDATLDPSQLSAIRPGKRVRMRSLVDGTWETIYAGKLNNANVDYNPRTNKPKVTLTAVDAVTDLVATQAPYATNTLENAKVYLDDVGAPWSVNGVSHYVAPTFTVESPGRVFARYEDENLSALEALALTRDTTKGFAWVNRKGVITAWDKEFYVPAFMPKEFSDKAGDYVHYSGIDVGIDSAALINVLNITAIETIDVEKQVFFTRADGTQESFTAIMPEKRESKYQFYNRPSMQEWGARSVNVTLLAPLVDTVNPDGSPATYNYDLNAWAQSILDLKSRPKVQATRLKFPVKDANSRQAASTVDLFVQAPVKYTDRVDSTYRVTSIEHSITPEKWIVTLGFNRRVDSALW